VLLKFCDFFKRINVLFVDKSFLIVKTKELRWIMKFANDKIYKQKRTYSISQIYRSSLYFKSIKLTISFPFSYILETNGIDALSIALVTLFWRRLYSELMHLSNQTKLFFLKLKTVWIKTSVMMDLQIKPIEFQAFKW
jgi:hypothetical protein